MNKNKIIKLVFIVIGILLIGLSIILNNLNYYRIIINIIGVLFLIIGSFYKNKDKLKYFPFYLFLYLIVAILIDSIAVVSFKTTPVYSYNIITNGNSRVYNAIGYRVWDCEGKDLKVDHFYKLGYYCDANNMESLDINSFLSNVVDNYDNYKNNYIKINGKISKKEGNNYIEMQSYQSNQITLNGYVNFSDKVTLRVIFKGNNEELNNIDVYDNITVVGKIWYIKNDNDKYVVYMDDGKIVNDISFNNYEIIVSSSNNCQVDKKLLYAGGDYNFYSHCLDNIVVKYDNNSIYELSSILSSGKLKVNKILENANQILYNDIDGSNLYLYDKYNILQCSESTGSDIIIGDTNLSFEDGYCGVILDLEED